MLTNMSWYKKAQGVENIPPVLYHATFKQLLPSIYKYGLGNYDYIRYVNYYNKSKGVWLASEYNVAISYVESSENESIPEDWFDDIVALKIDTSKINKNKLVPDPQLALKNDVEKLFKNDASQQDSFLYLDTIPSSAIIGMVS